MTIRKLLFLLSAICLYDGIIAIDLPFLYVGLVILISNSIYSLQDSTTSQDPNFEALLQR
ncbi:MAG: hypothetical protein NWE83_10530 [Candidatus Bathyarchaeota archaeon]|nr:hypothetical protein [Candidatus Bathyarchaeota archaeon]